MNSSNLPVREKFTLHQDQLVRELSIGSISGKSTVTVDHTDVSGNSTGALQSIWDKRFLTDAVKFPAAPQSGNIVRIGDVFAARVAYRTASITQFARAVSCPGAFWLLTLMMWHWTSIDEILIPTIILPKISGPQSRATTRPECLELLS